MKKVLVVLGLLSLMTPAFAADKYASVDIDKVLKGSTQFASANAAVQKEEGNLRVFVLDAQKKVVSAKTDAEKKALEEKYNKELQAKAEALQKKKIEALKSLDSVVKAEIDRVGKAGNYALILPSTSTLYGAVDITDQIIKGINASAK